MLQSQRREEDNLFLYLSLTFVHRLRNFLRNLFYVYNGCTDLSRHAETPEYWIIKFQLDSFVHIILVILTSFLQMYMICLQIWPKLPANVASSWNSRFQHAGVSASLLTCPVPPRRRRGLQQGRLSAPRSRSPCPPPAPCTGSAAAGGCPWCTGAGGWSGRYSSSTHRQHNTAACTQYPELSQLKSGSSKMQCLGSGSFGVSRIVSWYKSAGKHRNNKSHKKKFLTENHIIYLIKTYMNKKMNNKRYFLPKVNRHPAHSM